MPKVAPNYTAIYVLCDPDTCEIRYVGKTANVKKRYSSHCHPSYRSPTPCARWVNKLKKENKKPLLFVLEWAVNWEYSEKKWISDFREEGANLLNLHEGGVIRPKKNYFRTEGKRFSGVINSIRNKMKSCSNEVKQYFSMLVNELQKFRLELKMEYGQEKVKMFDDFIYNSYKRGPDHFFKEVFQ